MKSLSDTTAPKGRNHDRFITLGVAITGALIVAALWRFNQIAGGYEYYITGNAIALFFVPMVVILLVFGEEPSSFGFGTGESRRVRWLTLLIFCVLVVVILLPASRLTSFQEHYPIFKQFYPFRGGAFVETDLRDLLYAQISYGMYMFFWEFFFRGYLLFGLFRTIRWPAVVIQALAFGLLHYGKPSLEIGASFGAGIILGMLALRAKSFLPCFMLHWSASIAFDGLIIASRHG
ncbi:MAG: CPBP family intramembrane metalloprotease [Armatimonadetes bacterium]|nr:CPBP family intramembrane metalloprotease [Armatimonadota bacterium]